MHWRFAVRSALLLLVAGVVISPVAATTLPGFRSPSGNIRCFVLVGHSGDLLCAIGRSDYAKQLQARCIDGGAGVDWHGFTLGASRKGSLNCSGGIQYDPEQDHPATRELPYGASWRHRTFTCLSRIGGVTCHNRSGHGLFVSRAAWRAW